MKAIEFSELPSKSALMKRFDRKFLCSDDQMDALLQALDATHCYVNVQGVSHQVYQNEYWDKPNKDFYNDHRRGIPRRLKFRRRTYQGSSLSFWELKVKHPRGYQDKRRMTVDQATTSDGELAGLANRAFGLLLGDGRQKPGAPERLEPSMHITYQRMTLWDPAAGSRLTVDSQLQASMGGVRL
ncbi:MAG: VTC domain-containing protein, partial [Bacteroidota bacterium]